MIGRLLNAATTFQRDIGGQRGQGLQPAHHLESVTEEAHTRDLLYPDVTALRTSQHSAIPTHAGRVPATPQEAANYDDRGGLDVSYPTDLRIIIAQDASAKNPALILFDSKPDKASAAQAYPQDSAPSQSQRLHVRGKSFTSPQRPTQRGSHHHNPSVFSNSAVTSPTSPLSPDSRRGGLFGGPLPHLSPDITRLESESLQSRLAREKEEAEALLGCIFGSPGMRLESGTKLHVLPKNFPNAERGTSTRARPHAPGLSGHGQRSNFQRSATAQDMARSHPSSNTAAASSRTSVMITRLFNVHLPETAAPDVDPHVEAPAGSKDAARPGTAQSKDEDEVQRLKQKKTPMYAIAIIIQLPPESARSRSNPIPGMPNMSTTSFQLSAPNSPRSAVQIPPFGTMDGRTIAPPSIDTGMSIHITYILAHWTLMSRNIRLLEIAAQSRLKHLLEHIVPLAPVPFQSHGKAGNLKLRRPKVQSQQAVSLSHDALQEDIQIRKQTDEAAFHICLGLRAKRVVPGQGRWGAWREEARWVSRWAGTREQNFFFFVFISAFLGQHTDWLEHVAPRPWGSRAKKRRLYGGEDTDQLPQRTVIICNDKMAARRLVFLAASFLPTSFKTNPPAFMRPALINENYSESPPMLSTTPREHLSRRSTIRRDYGRSSTHQEGAGHGHNRSVSFSVVNPPGDEDNDTAATEDERMSFGEGLTRRPSEAGSMRSVRSTFTNLPVSSREPNKSRSSTAQADSALPVAHFATLSPQKVPRDSSGPRPGSNGSMASFALNSALVRSGSSTAGSTTSLSGRFGSMMSGFWSAGPESSTGGSTNDLPATLYDSSPVFKKPAMQRGQSTSGIKSALKSPTKLSQMVGETEYLSRGSPGDRGGVAAAAAAVSGATLLGGSPGSLRQPLDLEFILKKTPSNSDKPGARSIPARTESERLPITLNMNEEDGFVDVTMPQGMSINSSLASSFASLRMSSFGYSIPYGSGTTTWNSSGDTSEHHSPYGSPTFVGARTQKPESPPNVAGWLKTFHPDFALQAVRPYPGLDADIKQALELEAKLELDEDSDFEDNDDEWTSVCGMLVADATRFTVEKHTLQRRRRTIRPYKAGKSTTPGANKRTDRRGHASPPVLLSPSSSTASLRQSEVEERIFVEPVMDTDQTLAEAIDRVLAQSGPSSRAVSRVPSRAPSPVRSRPVSVKSTSIQHSPQSSSATKHEQLKQVQMKTRERAVSSATIPASSSPGAGSRAPTHVAFPECRRIIMGALEDVVKTVIDDRDLTQSESTTPKKGSIVLNGAGIDGTLREGVAKWLADVEEHARMGL